MEGKVVKGKDLKLLQRKYLKIHTSKILFCFDFEILIFINSLCVFYKIFLYLSRSNWTRSFLSSAQLSGLLFVITSKNVLIEVDWGQKLNFWNIRSLSASWSCWFPIYILLENFPVLCGSKQPNFLKYRFFINILIITISKVDFTKKLPCWSRLR